MHFLRLFQITRNLPQNNLLRLKEFGKKDDLKKLTASIQNESDPTKCSELAVLKTKESDWIADAKRILEQEAWFSYVAIKPPERPLIRMQACIGP